MFDLKLLLKKTLVNQEQDITENHRTYQDKNCPINAISWQGSQLKDAPK